MDASNLRRPHGQYSDLSFDPDEIFMYNHLKFESCSAVVLYVSCCIARYPYASFIGALSVPSKFSGSDHPQASE